MSENKIATRKAYGSALVEIGKTNPNIVVLDAETSNSTYAEKFKEVFPERFFECFIAEQNMVSMALGMARTGKIPFVSTFGAFLTRAHDQIRMCQYSDGNVKLVGSHSGVSIGEDGSSQMALEDLAMMRSILNSVVLYPSDSTSTKKLVKIMAETNGLMYMRTTRADGKVLYSDDEEFTIGGSKVVVSSDSDQVALVGAGVTLHECLQAAKNLESQNIKARVIDLYSIKPLDVETLNKALEETKGMIVVEDHYPEGGIYEAVVSNLITTLNKTKQQKKDILTKPIKSLAVRKMPMSGKPQELLEYEEIDAKAITALAKEIVR